MELKNYNLDQLTIVNMTDHFIIEYGETYFKVGIQEGKIITDLKNKKNFDQIVIDNNITNEYLSSFISELKQIGLIGETKKEAFNILFIKIPFYNPTKVLEIINKPLQNQYIKLLLLWSSILIILSGISIFIKNINSIINNTFNNALELHWHEYLIIYISLFLITFIHEIGHAIACKYYGGKVKYIGFLLLCFSPALYTDVSSTRLFKKKKEKIIVFLSGTYFQLIVVCITLLLRNYLHQYELLIDIFILSNMVSMITNFIPFIKLDGYWILSATLNITNLYQKSLKSVVYVIKNHKFPQNPPPKIKFIFIYGLFNFAFVIFSITTGLYIFFELFSSDKIPYWLKSLAIIFEVIIYLIIIYQSYNLFKNKKLIED